MASLQRRDCIQTSDDDTTESTLLIPKVKSNNNNTISVNPWQELSVSSTPSYLKTKSIHINNVDNDYQHDSSVLPSNYDATSTTNNNNSFLWNRAKNAGVRTKSQFMNRLQAPPMRRLLNTNQQQPTNHDVWSKQSYDSYRNNRVNITLQHQSEFMSLPLNHQTDCSSTTTTQIQTIINTLFLQQTEFQIC